MIEGYSIDDLKQNQKLILTRSVNKNEFMLFDYLKYNTNINLIEFCYNDYDNINKVINYVNRINQKVKFKKWIIDLEEQSIKDLYLIEKPSLLNIYLGTPNTKIIKLEKLLYLEKLLDLIVKDIKESNLSIYEKYICIYRIVTKFKEYKEEPPKKDINLSRNLYNILENEYIVCVGYAVLLKTLAKRIGIDMIEFSIFINENEVYEGHKRNIFYIEDKKYNINGIYISDSCWDSNYNSDLLVYSSLTENEAESENVKFERNWCKVLNFNNIDDFKKNLKDDNAIVNLIFTIKTLLNKEYEYFYKKYLENISEREYYKLLTNEKFIEELYLMINKYNNNRISEKIKMQANREVDKFIYEKVTEETLDHIENKRINDNKNCYEKNFCKKYEKI